MRNNTIGKISVATAQRQKTLKNKSSDLHTTMDFGSVMCGKLQRCIPGTSISVGTKERVLLTSLVAPTFGRMTLRAYHQFVPFSDLTRNYAPLMAQEPVYRGSSSFVPVKLPNVPLNELSMMVLFGAQMTIYQYSSSDIQVIQIPAATAFDAAKTSLPSSCQALLNALGISFNFNTRGLTSACRLNMSNFFGSSYNSFIALSNPTFASFFDYSTNHPNDLVGIGKQYVSVEGADYLIPVEVSDGSGGTVKMLLAFRLSSFGRRMRKNLIGCGWEFNYNSDDPVSLLPFLAFYKAYYDVFGLTLYSNWEESYAYKLLSSADLQSDPSWNIWKSTSGGASDGLVRDFFLEEFGNTYFTDEQDFVSSQIRNTAVAPSSGAFIASINTDIDSTNSYRPNISAVTSNAEPSGLTVPSGHAYINYQNHGQLDSNLLKRLYRQTNVQTVAGRRIAELLRAQGLGAYVDECKSNFIGSWSLDLNVYDLPAQSDTYQGVHDGMRLGELGAFGKSNGEHPMVRYETAEDGYFITLFTVVPKGGYAETVDSDLLAISKYQQYHADFDSLGYQYFKKLQTVQGSQPWANMDLNSGSLSDSFGLGPRYFDKKFGRNVINGDFSLRSTRHSYQPFCLERLIEVGEHKVSAPYTPSGTTVTKYDYEPFYLSPINVPIAGLVWRYLTRYEWISRFRRIFYNDSSSVDAYQTYNVAFGSTAEYEFFSLFDDNFIVHVVFEIQVYDQMLPVQDSYETSDDEKHADASMSKA